MPICPQCQFENSDANKFCQSCGSPLTLWWAIVQGCSQTPAFYGEASLGESLDVAPVSAMATPSTEPLAIGTAPLFLDPANRYRWLETGSTSNSLSGKPGGFLWEIQGKVLDYQPFQNTLFSVISPEGSATSMPDTISMPPVAQSYLALESRFYPTLPAVHDAWQQEGQQVLVLEDRSDLLLLADLCAQEPVPTMQILHWFHEMVELWDALEVWKSRNSLLELSNLRVDEDGILCLQRLYPDSAPYHLQDLGKLWLQVFDQPPQTLEVGLDTLIKAVHGGEITELGDLRTRLEAIAYDVQMQELEMGNEDTDVDLTPYLEDGVDLDDPEDPEEEEDGSDLDDMPTVVLPMQLYSVDDACQTDIGNQRNHNEEFFWH
ncbi:zinc-ribbon domain-containing protein [Neosynechococcus sphagnicola]|uniref:zinc-ribbon domain-containing protein n=1 Tax=Neosynechococcus sphagnicola TaxID=1501145 RepID=UPI00069025E8|nr:zinc-ribbon domain-containing protein [Neosynechococcus sphagnicola]